MDVLYQPNATGLGALDELDHVDWSRLQHAYGKGVVSLEGSNASLSIAGDVARSLAALRDAPSFAIGDGLYSNVCHQGTVYEATAHAVPFIAAVAAGDVPDSIRVPLLALLGDISIGGSYEAPHGSHSGAYGDQVGVLVIESLATSMRRFTMLRTPELVALVQAIRSLLDHSTDAHREAVESAIDSALTFAQQ
ncbi:hypothetical protein [Arthrobacter sp. fls2-241-R2A-172]|uniref:hypothetical protein n=1 Tax=Arthrobacter sp. fls2-241-R2A-172 TaxID=3040325 RepID=UPI00254C5DE8|nr:hypothetical protein [Arthrobacter sp. fls2-241-R2A-172]